MQKEIKKDEKCKSREGESDKEIYKWEMQGNKIANAAIEMENLCTFS